MATATAAYVAVSVAEGPPLGNVEYIGSVALADLAGLTAAQR